MKKLLVSAVFVVLGNSATALSDAELKEMSATIINLNGYLCARVTSIKPTVCADVWRISCIEYRNGSGLATYMMNAATAKVTRL